MTLKGWAGLLAIGLMFAILIRPPAIVRSSIVPLIFLGTGTINYAKCVDPIDCYYFIHTDDNRDFQMMNPRSTFNVDGLRIQFTANLTGEFTIHGIEAIVLNSIYLLGDLDGDLIVNLLDAYWLGQAFASRPSGFNWNPAADLNYDTVVDILDAILLASNYGVQVDQFRLDVNLGLNKTEYDLGEAVNVTLTVTNITNETAEFLLAPSYWDFLVYNDTDSCLYQWSHSGIVFPMWVMNVPLEPGMNITGEVMIWPQTCNATVDRYGTPVSPVSPGTYYIVGNYFYHDLRTMPTQITIA